MKRIKDSCQGMWGHDLAIIRSEVKHALAKDRDSLEMQKMMVRTDQLLQMMEATGSKVHQQGSKAETDGRAKKFVQSLKQHHAQFYCFYEKGSTRAMIGLQGLHSNDVF